MVVTSEKKIKVKNSFGGGASESKRAVHTLLLEFRAVLNQLVCTCTLSGPSMSNSLGHGLH